MSHQWRRSRRHHCHLYLILCLLSCHCGFAMSSLSSTICIFATCVPLRVPVLALSDIPIAFACSLIDSLQRNFHDSPVSFVARVVTVTFRAIPISMDALVSMSLCLVVGTVATLSMMMLSTAMRSSSHDTVVLRTLKFNRLSSIYFLTASIFSSSLIQPNLFLNVFICLTNVLRMSSS